MSSLSSEIWELCASEGNTETLKFLHENQAPGYTVKIFNLAASNGHLDVVQFLINNKYEQEVNEAINLAIKNHHSEISAYLLDKFSNYDLGRIADLAVEFNELRILDALVILKMKQNLLKENSKAVISNSIEFLQKDKKLKINIKKEETILEQEKTETKSD